MKYQFLKVQIMEDPIVLVTINRPQKRNALSIVLLGEIAHVFNEIQKHEAHRIIIINANGDVFSSGLDLYEAADPSLIEKGAMAVAALLTAIYTTPLVTIAAVQGDAIAGGAGIMAACDLAVVSKEAKVGFPETRRGIVAAQVATILGRQITMHHLRELLLTGELISSQRAYEMGLVNRVVPKDEVLNESKALAKQILKGAPQAIRATKQLIHSLDHADFGEDLKTALNVHRSARHTQEAREGIAAFLERRPPSWQN
jgi:methylglutaconyl-CoA hydratase